MVDRISSLPEISHVRFLGTYSHALADGMSGQIFFRDLLAAYETLMKQAAAAPVPPTTTSTSLAVAPLALALTRPTVEMVPFRLFPKLLTWFLWPLIKARIAYASVFACVLIREQLPHPSPHSAVAAATPL